MNDSSALAHYKKALSLYSPRFEDDAVVQAWKNARSRVMAHLLRVVATSSWQSHLVLRGSLLMKAWFGEMARVPKDIDWVFQPQTVSYSSDLANQLFSDLAQLIERNSELGDGLNIQSHRIHVESISGYKEITGRRILLPWQAEGLPPGLLKMDITFQEALPDVPYQIPLSVLMPEVEQRSEHVSTTSSHWVWAVSRRLSLAWKIIWIATDSYNSLGKDWYDAILLGEQVRLPHELLESLLIDLEDGQEWIDDLRAGQLLYPDDIDWIEFVKECPQTKGHEPLWKERLLKAWDNIFPVVEDSSQG